MAKAVLDLQEAVGAGPTWVSVKDSLVTYSLDDLKLGVTKLPQPFSVQTIFSFLRTYRINVLSLGDTTQIGDFKVKLSVAPPPGVTVQFKSSVSYAQATSGNRPAAINSDGATASGFTKLTTSYQVWDATIYALATGFIGLYLVQVVGFDDSYLLSGGNVIIPTLNVDPAQS